jgi:hypothetical protein
LAVWRQLASSSSCLRCGRLHAARVKTAETSAFFELELVSIP